MAPVGLEAITVATSPLDACKDADVIAVLTEWDDFRWVAPEDARSAVRSPNVVDARNLLDRSQWRRAGFEYQGIGR
jgi:UDPglucose 6-dehydrogenase